MNKNINEAMHFHEKCGIKNKSVNLASADFDPQIHEKLLRFLESGGGKELGLTGQIFLERGNLRSAEAYPGKYLVSVEGHRPVADYSFREGTPMAAFKASMQNFVFDPVASTLTQMDKTRLGRDVDVHALAKEPMQEFKPHVGKRCPCCEARKVRVPAFGLHIVSSSLDELEELIEDQFLEMHFDDILKRFEMTEEHKTSTISRFKDACLEIAFERLTDAWHDAEDRDGENSQEE